MDRIVIAIAIMALLLGVLSGCGKKDEDAAAGGDDASMAAGPGGPGGGMPGAPEGGPPAGGPGGGMPGGPEGGPPAGGPGGGMPGGPEGGAPAGGPGGGMPSGPGAGGPGGDAGGAPGGGEAGGGAPAAEAVEDEVPELTKAQIKSLLGDAIAQKHAGDLDEALRLASDVVKAEPENVEANWIVAWILADKDDNALAIGMFEHVLKLGLSPARAQEARAAIKRLKAREG